jgi:hypothetical protein
MPEGGPAPLHRIRVLVQHRAGVRHAFDLTFMDGDASVYVALPEPFSKYHYGKASFPPGEQTATFSVLGQLESSDMPHLSLHQSGQVHVRTTKGPKAGPLFIPPLAELQGGHVATVTAAHFEAFPTFQRERGADDQVIDVEHGVDSGRFAVYINGRSPSFACPPERTAFTVAVANPKVATPVYVAVAPWSQAALGSEAGVFVVAGFQPDGRGDDLLYLRAL